MAQTDLQYLGTTLLAGVTHNLGTDSLQEMIDREGHVKLAQAAVYELVAGSPMFSFSAGDTSVDKSKYATSLLKLAAEIRADYANFAGVGASATVSWSGSAEFGTASVEEYIDTDYNKPSQLW
jgi:hypothetical protein